MFPLSVNVRRRAFHAQIDEVCSLSIVIYCCLSSVLLHALLQIAMKHTLSWSATQCSNTFAYDGGSSQGGARTFRA